ncbi:uncharacterized protein DS421_15g513010 [Arachis hypogaea]|nr:uncharacterized protein DS421_15g513010 [Arachis hypogaea]
MSDSKILGNWFGPLESLCLTGVCLSHTCWRLVVRLASSLGSRCGLPWASRRRRQKQLVGSLWLVVFWFRVLAVAESLIAWVSGIFRNSLHRRRATGEKMNQFLGGGILDYSSGSLPLGLHNHIELPSNKIDALMLLRFNSDIGVHGQANVPSFATHHDVHPPALPMHLFQGVLSKGNMLTYNQVMEDSTDDSNHRSGSNASDNKPFYNFLEVKDPEWGKDAPGWITSRAARSRTLRP